MPDLPLTGSDNLKPTVDVDSSSEPTTLEQIKAVLKPEHLTTLQDNGIDLATFQDLVLTKDPTGGKIAILRGTHLNAEGSPISCVITIYPPQGQASPDLNKKVNTELALMHYAGIAMSIQHPEARPAITSEAERQQYALVLNNIADVPQRLVILVSEKDSPLSDSVTVLPPSYAGHNFLVISKNRLSEVPFNPLQLALEMRSLHTAFATNQQELDAATLHLIADRSGALFHYKDNWYGPSEG